MSELRELCFSSDASCFEVASEDAFAVVRSVALALNRADQREWAERFRDAATKVQEAHLNAVQTFLALFKAQGRVEDQCSVCGGLGHIDGHDHPCMSCQNTGREWVLPKEAMP